MKAEPVYYATPKPRQISQQGAVRLMSDLLADQEAEITKLRTLFVKHFCTCRGKSHFDRLDVERHTAACGYRKALE